jgi:hypothetical protein
MSLKTNQKIKFLQEYVRNLYDELDKSNPENIVAIRIGKKVINGKESRQYAIIFQVIKKIEENALALNVIIPKAIEIEFPDKKKRVVKTDIEETGNFKFHFGITSEVKSKYSIHFGTAGLYVSDNANRTYMLTNYHVVAESFISNGILIYRRDPGQFQNDVQIRDRSGNSIAGRFEEGIFSPEVDAAFVELPIAPNSRLNVLPDANRIQGRVPRGPLPLSVVNAPVLVYSYYNPAGRDGFINSNAMPLKINQNTFFVDVIQIRPRITQGGDSGGVVLTPAFAVIGIIIGGDSLYSYALPFYKFDNFKNVRIV